MGPVRGRPKKLILAFHFSYASRAGWECETCRKSGLADRRRCAFLGYEEATAGKPVWIRRNAVAFRCPKSIIEPESASLVDQFHIWKLCGLPDLREYPARTAEAFLILEKEIRLEQGNE